MAVYTKIDTDSLSYFMTAYALEPITALTEIAEGVENSNFLLETAQAKFILTLFEKRVRAEDLPWFMGLMMHLNAKGLPSPMPIPRNDGGFLGQLMGRPAAVTSFLPGRPVEPTREVCRALGEGLAKFHLLGADYLPERENGLSPRAWRKLFDASKDGADRLFDGLGAEIDSDVDRIRRQWPMLGDLPRGHIHADLFPDNIFFLKGQIAGIIDFYFACTDFLAYDLAICLNAWCFDSSSRPNEDWMTSMVEGYERLRPLTAAERHFLLLLAEGAALRFFLTRLYDWSHTPAEALVVPKDPMAYYHRLAFWRRRGIAL